MESDKLIWYKITSENINTVILRPMFQIRIIIQQI